MRLKNNVSDVITIERGRSNHLPRQAAASLQRPQQVEVGAGGSPVHQLLNSHRRDFYDHFIDFFGPKVLALTRAFILFFGPKVFNAARALLYSTIFGVTRV